MIKNDYEENSKKLYLWEECYKLKLKNNDMIERWYFLLNKPTNILYTPRQWK